MAAKNIPNHGGWHACFTFAFPDGRRLRVRRVSPVNTKRGAEQFEQRLRVELLNQSTEGKEVPTLSVFAEEFVKGYALANNKPSEVSSKRSILRNHLVPAFGDLRLDDICPRQVEQFKAQKLEQHLSRKTVNNILAVLGRLLSYAEECEIIDQAPRVRLLKKVPKPEFDYLTFEEADRLLAATKSDPSWFAMVFTALRTGLRYGELCELRWSDVDLVAGKLVVKRSFTHGHLTTPKNGKPRTLPLSPESVAVLKQHRGLRHLKDGLVFCKPDGGRRIHRRADVAIKRLSLRAELGRLIGWHVLRHTFASHLVMRGRSLKEIQELLGHSDVSTTLRYTHLGQSELLAAVSSLDKKMAQKWHKQENARSDSLQPGVFTG